MQNITLVSTDTIFFSADDFDFFISFWEKEVGKEGIYCYKNCRIFLSFRDITEEVLMKLRSKKDEVHKRWCVDAKNNYYIVVESIVED